MVLSGINYSKCVTPPPAKPTAKKLTSMGRPQCTTSTSLPADFIVLLQFYNGNHKHNCIKSVTKTMYSCTHVSSVMQI